MTDIVTNMEALARKWHEGAYRRGPEHLPYIVHPEAVVKLTWGNPTMRQMIAEAREAVSSEVVS